MWIRKFCSQATIALACALAMPHVAVVAWGQTPKVQNNQASFATEFESLFEQTDLSPYKPVCRCWVSQSDLNLESKRGFKTIFSALPEVDQATSPAGLLAKRGLVTSSTTQNLDLETARPIGTGLSAPSRDSFTSPDSNERFRGDGVARLKRQTPRGLLQPILEQDLQPDPTKRIPRPFFDSRLRPASLQEQFPIESQAPNQTLQLATQPTEQVEETPAESGESLIPDETSLEKLDAQIKEQIELVSKEAGDETVKQEQLQQLNTASSWIQKANNLQSQIDVQKKLKNTFEARLKELQAELNESPMAEVPDPMLDSEGLQMELQVKRQELQQLKTQLAENQRKMEDRDKRIEQLPADRTAAQEELSKSESGLSDLDQQPDGTSKQLSTLILKAKQWAARKEIEELTIESPRHEESGRLLPLERSVLSRKIQIIESEIQVWSAAYNEKRDQEIVDQANQAENLRQQVVNNDPGLNALAQLNHQLVEERNSWTAGIKEAQTYLKDVTTEREEIESSLNSLTQATEKSITTEVGISLVEQRHGLSLPWESQSRIQMIRSKLKDVRLKNLGWQEERQKLSSVDAVVEALMVDRHEHGLSAQELSLIHISEPTRPY